MASEVPTAEMDHEARRACDECRSRKIRCDKKTPCAPCRQARRTCVSTGPGQRLAGARQRVLISTQYERKFDTFEDRLVNIERHLERIGAALNVPSHTSHTQSSTAEPSPSGQASAGASTPSTTPISRKNEREPTGPVFEGDSSLKAHTTFVNDFVGHTVRQTAFPDRDPRMQTALFTLHQIVQRQNKSAMVINDLRFPNQKNLPDGGFRSLPMPPAKIVLQCLREMKESASRIFAIRCPYLTNDLFTEYCRRIYFSTEDFSPAIFVIVNGGLCYVMFDKILNGGSVSAVAEWQQYKTMCEENLMATLGDINPFLAATKENLEALLLAECYAIEASRPLLAWQMNCLAVQTCQTLGYHRLQLFPDDASDGDASDNTGENDTRPELMTFAYIMDKNLALNLGRASAFQDYDILMPEYWDTTQQPDPWRKVAILWFRHAQVQGMIYEQLYSAQAVASSREQRIQSVANLAQEVKRMIEETEQIRDYLGPGVFEGPPAIIGQTAELRFSYLSDMVTYYTTLTLIYRAVPSGQGEEAGAFIPECIEAGRAAFRFHLECCRLTREYLGLQACYILWIVLFCPFVPLVTIFCHIILTPDGAQSEADLARLEDFTASLEPTCEISEAIQQLHRLSQTLHSIAALYVKARDSDNGVVNKEAMDTMMEGPGLFKYLGQLGLAPSGGDMAGAAAVAGGGLEEAVLSMPSSVSLQDVDFGGWFSGNLGVMGLLEEDLSRFRPY